MKRWVASRFTVRASTVDDRLILWNTYSGSLSVFEPKVRPLIERMLAGGGIEGRRRGAIQFLADRGFLVEKGTDEYRRYQYAFSKQHNDAGRLHLLLLASEDCNFRCKYCYEEFARGTMEPRVRTGVKRYLERRIAGLKQLFVEWFGGEPLYGLEAIEDIAPFAMELAKERGVSYSSKVTTNGYLLTPEVFDKLLRWNVRGYQISLDGTPEHHDCNRPTRDGRGTFAVIFQNLVEMKRRSEPFLVSLRVNFDRENAGDLGRFLDMAAAEFSGDPRFQLNFRPVGRLGGPNDAQLAVCGSQEAIDLDLELREEARRRGLQLLDSIHHARGLGSQVCYAARPYSFLIGATGKVMKCTVDLDTKDRNVVGHLAEDGEMQLDDDKMALWTEPAFEHDSNCQKCFVLPACQGLSCPLVRWDNGRSPCPTVKTTFKAEMRQAAGDFAIRTAATSD
ncbi:MAG TPA: radical SAM protein [Thermoanaerobaculia bacterium]